jgi:hypothetical protein
MLKTTEYEGIHLTDHDIKYLSESLRRRARGTGTVTTRQVWAVAVWYCPSMRSRYYEAVGALAESIGLTVVGDHPLAWTT